nr:hypothetical protein [Tanacetum cinerariifolium]
MMKVGFLDSGGAGGKKNKSKDSGSTPCVVCFTVERLMVSSWERGWLTSFLLTISMDGLDFMLESGPWFIRNNPLILKKWNPDVNLMKEDVVNVLVWVKLHGVPITAFTQDGLSVIATDIADVEWKYTIVVVMPKLSGKGFICVPFMLNEWKPTRKKPTANTSGNKKKGVEPTKEVSNSNPCDVLNLVDNDEELGINGGIKTWLEKLIIDGKVTVVDDDGKLLKKIDYPGDHDSDDKVYSVHNVMARSMATETVGFGTKSFLECYGIGIGLVKQEEEQYRQHKASHVKLYVLRVDLDPYVSPSVFLDSAV